MLAVVFRARGLPVSLLLLLGVLNGFFFHGISRKNSLLAVWILLARENRLGRQPVFASWSVSHPRQSVGWVNVLLSSEECYSFPSQGVTKNGAYLSREPRFPSGNWIWPRERESEQKQNAPPSFVNWLNSSFMQACESTQSGWATCVFQLEVRKTARSELTHIMKQGERTLISSVKPIVGFHSAAANEKKSFLFPLPSGLSSAPLQVSLVDKWGRASQRESLEVKSCLPRLPLASKLLSSAFLQALAGQCREDGITGLGAFC